jgi:hypothetical protein
MTGTEDEQKRAKKKQINKKKKATVFCFYFCWLIVCLLNCERLKLDLTLKFALFDCGKREGRREKGIDSA